jgi:predicted phosphodiesterase
VIILSAALKFFLVSDLHLYASCFEDDKRLLKPDQKFIAESGAIIDSAFNLMAKNKDINIVLIAGDLTYNGELESHKEMIAKLYRLKNAGKRVFVITATHDFGKEPSVKYKGSDRLAETTPREYLAKLYYPFGRNEAISEDEESTSYCVKLAESYRLLCLNDDSNGKGRNGFSDKTLKWILSQIADARRAGDTIFAMTHHPVLPPSPIYELIAKRDMLTDGDKISDLFADAGLEFIFTGHSHMQNISVKLSKNGNRFYDINTGSLVGYPNPIRVVTLDDEAMRVETINVTDFKWDFDGVEPQEYLKNNFSSLLNEALDAAANDIEKLAQLAVGISVKPESILKLRVPITLFGRFINKLTVGQLGKMFFISSKIDKSIENLLVKNVIIDIFQNLYCGDEPYYPGTPIYTAVEALFDRILLLTKRSKYYGKIKEILYTIKDGVLYDAPPSDNNAVLPRQNRPLKEAERMII